MAAGPWTHPQFCFDSGTRLMICCGLAKMGQMKNVIGVTLGQTIRKENQTSIVGYFFKGNRVMARR